MQGGEGISMLCGGLKGPFVDAARCVGKRGKYSGNACVCSTYSTVYTGSILVVVVVLLPQELLRDDQKIANLEGCGLETRD